MERPHPTFAVPEHVLARRIGGGSSGDVWLARDSLGTWRAVKFVWRGEDGDESALQRELEGLRRYEPVSRRHPALLDVLFAGMDPESGTLYYVMELADDAVGDSNQPFDPTTYRAATLSRRLRMRPQGESGESRRLPAAEVLELARTLADGLSHLHAEGLIHRDIKAGNIVFVRGQPCLADCGLVSTSEVARSFVGTEGFIPPEGPGTPAADVYALGKVVYEAAFGMDRKDWPGLPAWFGNTPDAAMHRELLAVIHRACAADPAARYPDARPLLADLRLLAAGGSVVRHAQIRSLWRRMAVAFPIAAAIVTPLLWWTHRSPFTVERLSHKLNTLSDIVPINIVARGTPKLVFYGVNGNQIEMMTGNGEVRGSWSPPGESIHGLNLMGLPDSQAKGMPQRFASWSAGDQCVIAELSAYNDAELRRFTSPGQITTNAAGGVKHLSKIHPEWVADLDGDGRRELVAVLLGAPTGNPARPLLRQILAFDYDSGMRKWAVDVASNRPGSVVPCPNRAGGVALLAGSYSSANGHHAADGSDDSHAAIHALGPDGTIRWRRETGGYYMHCQPRVIAWPDGITEFYTLTYGNNDFRRNDSESSRVIRFDVAGKELGRFDRGLEFQGWHVLHLDDTESPEILVAGADGNLRVLDRNLNERRVVELARRRRHRVEVRFVGEADLDGNGVVELVLVVGQCEPVNTGNPGSDSGGLNSWNYRDLEVLVLNRKLEIIARERIVDETDRSTMGSVQLFDPGGDGRPLILVPEMEPRVFAWRGRALPGAKVAGKHPATASGKQR